MTSWQLRFYIGISSTSLCSMNCMDVVFSNGNLLSVYGEQPIQNDKFLTPWHYPRLPCLQQLRLNSILAIIFTWSICKQTWNTSALFFPCGLRGKETCNLALSKSIFVLIAQLYNLVNLTSLHITICPENLFLNTSVRDVPKEHYM